MPFGHDGKSKDRLSAEEIKALTFGHTLRAEDIRTGRSFTDVVGADGTVSTSGDLGSDTGKVLYLGDSLICCLWNEWSPGCAAIFRSTGEGLQSNNAFTLVDASGEYRYSIER